MGSENQILWALWRANHAEMQLVLNVWRKLLTEFVTKMTLQNPNTDGFSVLLHVHMSSVRVIKIRWQNMIVME